jgi:site-specific recombinase XerD
MKNSTYDNLLKQLDRLFRHNNQGSIKTRERYYEAMKRFCRFLADSYGLEKLANVAPKHFISYIKYMKNHTLSISTIKTDISAIRFWHDKMDSRHKLPDNTTLDLSKRSFGRTDRTWSDEAFSNMLNICRELGRDDYSTLFMLARYAGLRIHECFRIDTTDARKGVNSLEITVVGKGGKLRNVKINETVRDGLIAMLKTTKQGDKLFVPNDVKTHVAIQRFERFVRDNRDEAQQDSAIKKPLTFHGLRHTYAAEQYNKFLSDGFSEKAAKRKVSKLLGHEREEITNIYLASTRNNK